MNALSTNAEGLSGRTPVRFGLALFVAVGLVVFPFEAMIADPIEDGLHVKIEEKVCTAGCNPDSQICCV